MSSDIAVATNSDGRLEVFARGMDGAVWHRWITRGSWSGWASLGGRIPEGATPHAVLNAAGGLQVFARGMDNTVYHNWHVPAPPYWSGWHPLGGGPVASDPYPIRNADGRIELLALSTDRTLVHRWQLGAGWNS